MGLVLFCIEAKFCKKISVGKLPVDEYVPPHVGGCPANASDVGSAKVYHVLARGARAKMCCGERLGLWRGGAVC